MAWLRKIIETIISENPQTGKVDDLGGVQESQFLEDDDAMVTYKMHRKTANHCGCFGEPGGRCSEEGCGVISCVKCHRHCGGTQPQHPAGCYIPLCRRHVRFFTFPDGAVIPFCQSCFSKLSRRQAWTKVGKFLFEPLGNSGGDGRG